MGWNRLKLSWDNENQKKILGTRGIHQGKQCVVMATGPSLNEVDLSLIEDHPFVMGVNGAFHHRNHFRYYFCSSSDFYLPNENRINEIHSDYFFFSSFIPYKRSSTNIYLKLDEKSMLGKKAMEKFQPNLLATLSWGPTVLLDLVFPVLLWMKFSQIILLGANYSLHRYRHFYPETEHKTVFAATHHEEEMRLAHHGFGRLLRFLQESEIPVEIYNCSPSSDLPHFPKAPLEKLIKNETV